MGAGALGVGGAPSGLIAAGAYAGSGLLRRWPGSDRLELLIMSPSKHWFSTKVRVYCMVEGAGVVDCWEPVHVFAAENLAMARERALQLGRGHDQDYLNGDAQRVRWRCSDILSLDDLGTEPDLDGREVYFDVAGWAPRSGVDFDTEFHPELSDPEQTGV